MTQAAFTLPRWFFLQRELGIGLTRGEVFRELQKAYREPHRRYHTIEHINESLAWLDRARELAEQPALLEYAIWFHDAVYDPHANDNEQRSADWAVRSLVGHVSESRCETVRGLIMATGHRLAPATVDQALIMDIDLMVFAKPPGEFDRYDRAIREEYHWVVNKAYRLARAEVLRIFLERERIYCTDWFHNEHEAQARENLARKIERLEG